MLEMLCSYLVTVESLAIFAKADELLPCHAALLTRSIFETTAHALDIAGKRAVHLAEQ